MIKEFSPLEFEDCLDDVLEGSGVVVRGAVEPELAKAIAAYVPNSGRQRVYISPTLSREQTLRLPLGERSKGVINKVITHRLGRFATLWGAYVMRPDMLRAGMSRLHVDGRGTIISASLNLDNGGGNCAFYANRIAEADAPYSHIRNLFEQTEMTIDEMDNCELGVGDMMLISRGVVHGAVALDERRSITYRVRGMVRGDFQ